MLEEDGRIDEQIFNEYVALNLRYPPVFLRTHSSKSAFQILENDKIDLVITMLSVEDIDAFELCKLLKQKYPKIPVVILTPFSREISIRLQSADPNSFDYVFCWLGNADILLAIIKLIEDKMNTPWDVEKMGVQVLLLVEDSIRYYSSYLPNIYKIVFQQSKRSMSEGLNQHQQMLRMRGRPKIILATNYEEAHKIYNKYKDNILGVISDISYNKNGIKDPQAGIKLCRYILKQDEHIPFILQSSDIKNEAVAKSLNVGFIAKYSKSLSYELRNYIIKHMAFGDFVFRNPENQQEITRATDLKSLQEKILKVPDESIDYHIKRNDFYKWMNARALFQIAQLFKHITPDYFSSIDEVRTFIFDVIDRYRKIKGRGVISKFDRTTFDEYLNFSRIGDGSIGGKARGLAFADMLLKKYKLRRKYDSVIITIPRTVVLSTDIFDEFMESNKLYNIALKNNADDSILSEFIAARLPNRIHQDLYSLLSNFSKPIAVRSSSKLEDSYYQPFAGVYSTYMVQNIKNDTHLSLYNVTDAIKSVYASVYFKASKAYITATSNIIDEEKMGVILQEVCGSTYKKWFYPAISGVARSVNYYPIEPEKSDEGIANLAIGLGKYIVDGGISLRFSPKYPDKCIQLSSPETALKETQKYLYALDINNTKFQPDVDDCNNLVKLKIKDVENDPLLRHTFSTYDFQNNIIRDGINYEGKKIVTFSNILKNKLYPFSDIISELLEIGEKEMNHPIEIEFAIDLNAKKELPAIFYFLQIRPIVFNDQSLNFDIGNFKNDELIIRSDNALGNGVIRDIQDFVYVKPESFDASKNIEIAKMIEQLNEKFVKEKKYYVLCGPGRWGSSDPWLGIPVKWADISMARVIIEAGLKDYRIDPSQGTHFFQNLISFRVGYFTLNPYENKGFYDIDFLNKQAPVYENQFIRHIKFDKPINIYIDGKNNIGLILKPIKNKR
ncbi:MAG: PEP/pyruvate-binding domain-containing protein [Marinilabiliales bacterium]